MQIVLGIVGACLLVAASLLAVPVVVLSLQVLAGYRALAATRPARTDPGPSDARPDVAVLIPAHDEADGIAASIASVKAQLTMPDRLLVVADNCSDETARVAREAGAEVVVRDDPERRGKGYALDRGVRHLGAAAPAIVVIVDADCLVADGAIDTLARCCAASRRPVQALYLMHSPAGAPLKTRIAEFAWVIKNQVRPLGYHRLGLPCQLMGTGMAFPWDVIEKAPLASGHIVEDLQLGLDLAAAGTPPLFCPGALVTSVFPLTPAALATQRTRWEHGHLGVIAGMAPRLLWRAAKEGRGALAALVVDLCVPPLAALVMALCVVTIAAALLVVAGGPSAALFVAGAAFLLLVGSLSLAWRGFARHIVTWRELASAPSYVFGKVGIYARMFRRKQTDWVRTRRDDGTH